MHDPSVSVSADMMVELRVLADTITATRAELADLRVDDITREHIPSATDELDAVVEHTASATDKIFEACEALDVVGGTLARGGPEWSALQSATERIYEACSFQDITGQRITKVVAALKKIEAVVARVIGTVEQAPERPRASAPLVFLQGPQLPASALLQNDIDQLLAGAA